MAHWYPESCDSPKVTMGKGRLIESNKDCVVLHDLALKLQC